jgi:hypothetical protein
VTAKSPILGDMKLRLLTIAAATCLALGGCSASDRPAMAPVSGKVTFQGKPIAGATVVFLCPGAPRQAVGTTDASGTYRLTTFESSDGAVVGTHVVTVKKGAAISEEGDAELETNEELDSAKEVDDAVKRTLETRRRVRKSRPEIPAKYAHRSTSDLSKDVIAGDNVINIELSK